MANITTKTVASHLIIGTLTLFALATSITFAQKVSKDCIGTNTLRTDLYQFTCPEAEEIVFTGVERAVRADPRMAASLLRMHFHDCFVNGCDASLLLDDTDDTKGEKTAAPNLNSLRGFEVIDAIKTELESVCPETVSCADVVAVAARDSVVLSGGPTWQVEMGRKDSLTASLIAANNSIPAPTSDVATLTKMFQNVGLSQKDMVALSGAHTIGKAKCNLSSGSSRQCGTNSNGVVLAQLDEVTPVAFDNFYFKNLLSGNGFLASDQTLVSGNNAGTVGLVQTYATDLYAFFEDFKNSMVRMGRLGSNGGGEIRRSCRVVN